MSSQAHKQLLIEIIYLNLTCFDLGKSYFNLLILSSFFFDREFENEGYVDIGETMFKFVVHQAVKNLFGEVMCV